MERTYAMAPNLNFNKILVFRNMFCTYCLDEQNKKNKFLLMASVTRYNKNNGFTFYMYGKLCVLDKVLVHLNALANI